MIEMADIKEWESYIDSPIPVVLLGGADWCGPCQKLKPIMLKEAENPVGKVQYVYFDVGKFPQLSGVLEIKTTPQAFIILDFQGSSCRLV